MPHDIAKSAFRFVRQILAKKMYTPALFTRRTSNVRPLCPVQSRFDVRLASETVRLNQTIVHMPAHHFIGGGGGGGGGGGREKGSNIVTNLAFIYYPCLHCFLL